MGDDNDDELRSCDFENTERLLKDSIGYISKQDKVIFQIICVRQ